MNTPEPKDRHWMQQYGELRGRWETDPASLLPEDLAKLEALELAAGIEGPEQVFADGLKALWGTLQSAQQADAPHAPQTIQAKTEEPSRPSATERYVTHWTSAKSIKPSRPLEELLAKFRKRSMTVVRLRDFGGELVNVEQADAPIFELRGTTVTITAPEGVTLVEKGEVNPSPTKMPSKWRSSELEQMDLRFELDEAKSRVLKIEIVPISQ